MNNSEARFEAHLRERLSEGEVRLDPVVKEGEQEPSAAEALRAVFIRVGSVNIILSATTG